MTMTIENTGDRIRSLPFMTDSDLRLRIKQLSAELSDLNRRPIRPIATLHGEKPTLAQTAAWSADHRRWSNAHRSTMNEYRAATGVLRARRQAHQSKQGSRR
jgi:hypothetical protein